MDLLLPAEAAPSDERNNHEHQPDHKRDIDEAAKRVRADKAKKPQGQKDDSDNQ